MNYILSQICIVLEAVLRKRSPLTQEIGPKYWAGILFQEWVLFYKKNGNISTWHN